METTADEFSKQKFLTHLELQEVPKHDPEILAGRSCFACPPSVYILLPIRKNNYNLNILWTFSIYVNSGKKKSCSTVELVGNGFGKLTPPRQILGKFMGGFEWKKTYRSKARCHPKASLHTLRYCLIFLRCVFARSEPNLTTHNFYAIQRVGIWEGAKYFFLDAKGIVSSTVCCRMQKKTCGKEDAKLCWRFDAGILPLTLHRSGFTLQNNAVHQNAWVGVIIFEVAAILWTEWEVPLKRRTSQRRLTGGRAGNADDSISVRWFVPSIQKLFACLVLNFVSLYSTW